MDLYKSTGTVPATRLEDFSICLLCVPHVLLPNSAVLNVLSSDSKESCLAGRYILHGPFHSWPLVQLASPLSQQRKDYANSSGHHLKFDWFSFIKRRNGWCRSWSPQMCPTLLGSKMPCERWWFEAKRGCLDHTHMCMHRVVSFPYFSHLDETLFQNLGQGLNLVI